MGSPLAAGLDVARNETEKPRSIGSCEPPQGYGSSRASSSAVTNAGEKIVVGRKLPRQHRGRCGGKTSGAGFDLKCRFRVGSPFGFEGLEILPRGGFATCSFPRARHFQNVCV
jgi:hypothetical protein